MKAVNLGVTICLLMGVAERGAAQNLMDRLTAPFRSEPHITMGSVAPGGGISGGIGYSPKPYSKGRLFISARALGSQKQYWTLEAGVAFQSANRFRVEAFGRGRRMTQLPFFGIGPQAMESSETSFLLLDRSAGVLAWVRPHPSFAVGSRLEGLWPRVGRGRNADLPSIEQRFNEASAPGVTAQPSFSRYQAFVDINYPTGANVQARQGGDVEIGYNVYHDNSGGRYSFRRFNAEARQRFMVLGVDRKLTLHGLISTATTAAGHDVPFYLQPTLGGASNLLAFHESPIGGDETVATLRGVRNFRFRDRDLILGQIEFRQKLPRPLGLLDVGAFIDVGKVGHAWGDLNLSQGVKHSFGLSLSLMRGTATIARFDLGFGAGEGTHGFLTPGRVIGR